MNYPSLTLAFIGDAIFELKIREHYVKQGITKVNKLQTLTSNFASAKSHKEIMDYLISHNLLSEEELNEYKRGRNAKVNQRRKNFNPENYHASTGFEAMIGYLHLSNQQQRLEELLSMIIERFDK